MPLCCGHAAVTVHVIHAFQPIIMIIQRNSYLQQLIDGRENGLVKIVTGIRRCGKSFLLFRLFVEHLRSEGVADDHIIRVALDDVTAAPLRDALALYEHIRSQMTGNGLYFILLDEVQLVPRFEEVLNSLLRLENADVYVTGSNSRFLSSDIITEFRGRGDEIRVFPLSFAEFCQVTPLPQDEAWAEYYTFGGLPHVLSLSTETKKINYLQQLVESVYLRDVTERHRVRNPQELAELLRIVASSIGAPCNPTKLSHTFQSVKHVTVSPSTLNNYLGYLQNAFLLEKSMRYDIKGKRYINNLAKYYFTDLGLRNALLGMRQQEETHIMENVLYNELRRRGCCVDVGVVEKRTMAEDKRMLRQQLEVDFVVNYGSHRCYIQSALMLPDADKRQQEMASLIGIRDSFSKMIVVKGRMRPWTDVHGVLTIGLFDFLLDERSHLR